MYRTLLSSSRRLPLARLASGVRLSPSVTTARLFSSPSGVSSDGSHSDFQKHQAPSSSSNNSSSATADAPFDAQKWLAEVVQKHDILLFMKGTPENPRCGFSSTVVQILNTYDAPYASADVLENEDIRAGLKEFSKWPTFPQLYVKGEFVGGCDIVKDMHAKGELKPLLVVEKKK